MSVKKELSTLFSRYNVIIVFDVETSGLNPVKDQIVELAAVKLSFTEGKLLKVPLSCYIQLYDNHRMSEEASTVNHITEYQLYNYGITITEAVEQFLELAGRNRCLLVAHNAAFDLSFLECALRKVGNLNFFYQVDTLDTLTVFKDRHPYPHKLEDAIKVYHLTEIAKNSHSAMDDTNALVHVLIKLEEERDDLLKYINLFGFNPKYPPTNKIKGYMYVPQPYNSKMPLYKKVAQPPQVHGVKHDSLNVLKTYSFDTADKNENLNLLPQQLRCPDCKGNVSSRAQFCPNCGCPIGDIIQYSLTKQGLEEEHVKQEE